MFTDKKSILILASLLKEHGIKDIVLSPGSRNAPIIHTLTSIKDFRCHAALDERGAGFFAIGLALYSGKPTVVCSTSGSALLNLHPSIAEAFYQEIPLIVISADRPKAWIGQMDGQTLPQNGVFNNLVKLSVDLPEVHTNEDYWYTNRLINEAILETIHKKKGPVHINIPISEPLYNFNCETLPKERKITRIEGDSKEFLDKIKSINAFKKCMIVVGQMPPNSYLQMWGTPKITENFVFLKEHLSNIADEKNKIGNFDLIISALNDKQKKEFSPELLITFGGHIVSKRLKKLLRENPPKEHWHISENGKIVDLFGHLTSVFEIEPKDFFKALNAYIEPKKSSYLELWRQASKKIPKVELPFSEISAIGSLISLLPEDCIVHLANSSTVRYAQFFPLKKHIEVYCNRGVNGIEGSLSTALGYASVSKKLNFIIIGDLSFFYDMNALWQRDCGDNLRILLLNNHGGEIFNTLPGIDKNAISHSFITFEHKMEAESLATGCGFTYLKASSQDELLKALEKFTSLTKRSSSILLEVFTDKEKDTNSLEDFLNKLKI